ncbi:10253_t:CDS:2, partial [Funneliformis geosporum]
MQEKTGFGGPGIDNSRNAVGETKISPDNVNSLTIKYEIPTDNSVSATPVTFKNNVYFPDWAGFLYSVDAKTGTINWKFKVSEKYLPQPADPKAISRDTFAIDPTEQLIVLGTQNPFDGGSGFVMAIDLQGELVWITLIDDHPYAGITQSPTIYNGGVYIGVSSSEEEAAAFNPGKPSLYSGNAVWGSAPAIDPIKGLVYISTGNNYDVPPDILDCLSSTNTTEEMFKCHDPKNYINTILALDINNVPYPDNCPKPSGPDYACKKHGCPLLAIATAKSGITWAINAVTGEIYWYVESGPGRLDGGSLFGSATNKDNYVFKKPSRNSPPSTNGGALVAIDVLTGKILWQTANPTNAGGAAPVSYANGVVWYGSRDDSGHLYALDAETGDILYDFITGGTVSCGPSIVDGVVFAGSGYQRFGSETMNNR